MSNRTVACGSGCGAEVVVPEVYKALTDLGVKQLGLICPACLRKIADDNLHSAADHIGGMIENLFTVGTTAATAAKQQLKPAARGAVLRLRDRLNHILGEEETPLPPDQSQ